MLPSSIKLSKSMTIGDAMEMLGRHTVTFDPKRRDFYFFPFVVEDNGKSYTLRLLGDLPDYLRKEFLKQGETGHAED